MKLSRSCVSLPRVHFKLFNFIFQKQKPCPLYKIHTWFESSFDTGHACIDRHVHTQLGIFDLGVFQTIFSTNQLTAKLKVSVWLRVSHKWLMELILVKDSFHRWEKSLKLRTLDLWYFKASKVLTITDHPFLIKLYHAFQTSNYLCLVMEFAEGMTHKSLLIKTTFILDGYT